MILLLWEVNQIIQFTLWHNYCQYPSLQNDVAALYPQPEDMERFIRSQVYKVTYDEMPTPYDWPAEDMRKRSVPTVDNNLKKS